MLTVIVMVNFITKPSQMTVTVIYVSWQCSSGSYSTAEASACTVCPAGKYLLNGSVGAEAEACTNVGAHKSASLNFVCMQYYVLK